jgi:hypothetical protein
VFRFSSDELNYLESRFRQRIEIMRQLFPWDDPNYGIDEQWAVFYPYGLSVQPRQQSDLQVRITNHSPSPRRFVVRPHVPAGAKLLSAPESVLTLASRQTGQVPVTIEAPSAAGNVIVTADVESEGMEFGHWIEAMLTVQ